MERNQGFSLVELLVSMTVVLLTMTGVAKLTIENSRINRAQQMTAQVQGNARNCMALIVQKLRSAGWDPLNTNLQPVVWDAIPSDGISEIEVFTDLDGSGDTNAQDEQIVIRHESDRILMRRSNNLSAPFIVVGTNMTNDADGDGVVEEMFTQVLDPLPTAERVLVQITARSPVPHPMTGDYIRYTVRSEVALRKTL